MIITCPNCNKQFKIDNSEIPKEGRELQCGSCNHVWFHKIDEEKVKKEPEIKIEDEEIKITEKKHSLEKYMRFYWQWKSKDN